MQQGRAYGLRQDQRLPWLKMPLLEAPSHCRDSENMVQGRTWQSPSCAFYCLVGESDIGSFGLGLPIQEMNLVLIPKSEDHWEGLMK